jgi:hypothetical protein
MIILSILGLEQCYLEIKSTAVSNECKTKAFNS